MADSHVVRPQPGAQGELGFRYASARSQAVVAFGSRRFRMVLKATTHQDVGCMAYQGADLDVMYYMQPDVITALCLVRLNCNHMVAVLLAV